MTLAIDSDFDGGNIRCLAAPAPGGIRLEIVPDAGGVFFQWFHFCLSGAAGRDCVLRIENAAGAAYPEGWRGYRAVASEDGEDWPRVATDYDGKVLTIRHRPAGDRVHFAYFVPYPMARPCRPDRPRRTLAPRHRALSRHHPRRRAARPAGDRRGAKAHMLDRRPPASR